MKTGKKKPLIFLTTIIVLVILNILVGGRVYLGLADTDSEIFSAYEKLVTVETKIKQNYVDDVESSFLLESALKGMLSNLDPHCRFISPSEYKAIKAGRRKADQSADVGILLTKENSLIGVRSVLYGSPAYSEDILPGDIIREIDNEKLIDADLFDVEKQLKGAPDTEIKLRIIRLSVDLKYRIKNVTLKRKQIEIRNIPKTELIDGHIGYIKIAHFGSGVKKQFRGHLKELIGKGADAFVVDLRDNATGSVKEALGALDFFIPEGTVLGRLESRDPDHNRSFKSAEAKPKIDDPAVFLVNKGTTGAAEMAAAAIKGTDRGIVLGEVTFGMAIEQSIIEIEKGAALELTTGNYYTSNGEKISGKGVEPHIVVEVSSEEQFLRHKNDMLKPEEQQSVEEESVEVEDIRELFLEKEEKDKEKKFVDTQLQKAVDILKALRVYYTAA